jgi:nucleoside-diphosphate-sugar epimerase
VRIVVTGAAGRVGRVAVEALAAHELVLVDRRRVPGHPSIVADLARPPDSWLGGRWDRALAGADVVLHLAAVVDPAEPWARVRRHNVDATWHVLQATASAGVARIVLASSTWAVRAAEGSVPGHAASTSIGSATPPRPLTAYGLSKAFGELAGRMLIDEGRLRTCVAVRLGFFPPAGVVPPEGWLRERWIGARDLATLLCRCVEADLTGFHVVYGISAVPGSRFDLAVTRRLLGWSPSETPPPDL